MRRFSVLVVLNVVLLAAATPYAAGAVNDPFFARQWALSRIKAEKAWPASTGSGVTIAVIDTGIDLRHEDLAANLVPGTTVFKCTKTSCANGQDDHGHGTHVAGIAAAVQGNGRGVAGVAPSAKVMPVKVLDSGGSGSTDDIAAGIRYAVDKGARVLNLSLGVISGVGTVAKILGELDSVYSAIDYAWSKGAVVVVAAGNDTFPVCAEPAAHPKAVCVGATDNNDLIAYYSNSGDIDVTAPGGFGSVFCEDYQRDVLSTIWPGSSLDCRGGTSVTGYDTLAGTSMAAPHVAAVAALIRSRNPGWTAQQVVDRLYAAVDDLGLPGADPVYGRGRINACKAVAAVC